MEEQKNSNGIGALVGTIIVILILIVGGFYFYGQRVEKQKQLEASALQASSSDEIVDIENDINALDLDSL